MTAGLTDEQIGRLTKTLFRFCQSRTGSYHDAEDLAQDILLAACKEENRFPNEKAFYAFVWKTADNVLRNWYRRKARTATEELDENYVDRRYEELEEASAWDERLQSVIRELARLSSDYRRVAVEYYFAGKSVREIAAQYSLSESMVKYLLFQSRKHIKEGIHMEKQLGKLSYAPVTLTTFFWGEANACYGVFEESRLRQNIVMACYYDRLTEEQLSLQLGVPTAYLEDELRKLTELDLLIKKGLSYQSNIVIITDREKKALKEACAAEVTRIAGALRDFFAAGESAIRELAFYGSDMPANALRWLVTSHIFRRAYLDMFQGSLTLDLPVDRQGKTYFRFLLEQSPDDPYATGVSGLDTKDGVLLFWDVPVNGMIVHHFVTPVQASVLASLRTGNPATDSEKLLCAELLELGIARKEGERILPNFACLTAAQFGALSRMTEPLCRDICESAMRRIGDIADILAEYAPEHLADYARRLSPLLFLNESGDIAQLLCESGWLLPYRDGILPTTVFIENR